MNECIFQTGLESITDQAVVKRIKTNSETNPEIAADLLRYWGVVVSDSFLLQHSAKKCSCYVEAPKEAKKPRSKKAAKEALKAEAKAAAQATGSFTTTTTTAKLETGALTERIEDNEHGFDEIIRRFGFDPAEFRIRGDSVSCSVWDQRARDVETGEFEVVQLYAYKAVCERITPEDTELDFEVQDAAKWLRKAKVKPNPPRRSRLRTEPETYVHLQGDEQTGKHEGGGLQGLAEREFDVIEKSVQRLRSMMADGHNVTQIADLSAGDRVENIFGHYASQARTTSTLREQLKFARDMDLARTRAFAEFNLPIKKVYTPSNHGEMRQNIGQAPFTSESDNLDLIIAEMVKDVVDETPMGGLITWHIPHDDFFTFFNLHGVGCGLTHGHKVRGAVPAWMLKQRDSALFHNNFKMRVAFAGHRHHFFAEDIGGTSVIMTPSLDGGSPYFAAMTGNKASSGAVSLLVSEQYKLGWHNLAIL